MPGLTGLKDEKKGHCVCAGDFCCTGVFFTKGIAGLAFEHYIYKNQKKLRCGYTTGSCAAIAARGAVRLLLTGKAGPSETIVTPSGVRVCAELLDCARGADFAQCAVRKDGGDDPDATDGVLVYARAEKAPGAGVSVEGGKGVGRVTKKGLDQPVGAAAINRVPRRMILLEAERAGRESGYPGGLRIVISVPEGEKIAAKTFNPRLGIEGGISILGTSGIVEPMSEQAMADSIRLELSRLRADGRSGAVLTPGNYGADFLKERFGALLPLTVKCSNFFGATLDNAVQLGFERILVVGHIGKLVKLAAGIMNTHSRWADARMEILTAHAALCGAPRAALREVMDSATCDAALEVLGRERLVRPVMESVMEKIGFHLSRRVGCGVRAEAVMFSNGYGLLGETAGADGLIRELTEES